MDGEYLEQHRLDLENEKIFSEAKKILDDLGLTIEGILRKNKTLDLGASTAAVEKAIHLRGYPKKFVSFSLETPNQVKNRGLNYVKGNASLMPFESNAFDLIISRNGPLYLVEKQFEAEKILKEMFRVQAVNGESRVFPIRFGFIKRQLFDQNPEYYNIHSKAPVQRTKTDLNRLNEYNREADIKTQDYLLSLGLHFKVRNNTGKDSSEYLIFEK